ncbi:MAG: LPS export ABC transporter permease LptF [Candidatus Binataceae bacterium]
MSARTGAKRKLTILDRYVALQVLGPFALGVVVLTFALVSGRMLKLTDMIVNHGVTLPEVGKLLAYIMPGFLELTFPMALLIGVLLGFGRMSSDHEMTAARSCGVSLYRLAAPVMIISILVYALSSWFAFSVRPWSMTKLGDQLYQLSRTRTSAGLQEKIFNRGFNGLAIYVDRISDTNGNLLGVLISDARDRDQPTTIIARRGIILPDDRTESVTLRLFNGSVFGVGANDSTSNVTHFRIYDISIRPKEMMNANNRDPTQMSWVELNQTIADARAAGKPDLESERERASKFTIPIASPLFALLGIALGLKPARGGHSERFGISVAAFFIYYALMRVGQTLAENGLANAFVAMAVPDVAFAVLAVWLFQRAAQDRGDQARGPGDIIWIVVERFGRKEAA